MSSLLRALYAEVLKLRRTLALRLAILTPLVLVALQTVVFFGSQSIGSLQGEDAWLAFDQQLFILWALLVLPLFVSLETALLAGLEHKDEHWKHLHALPVSRGGLYAAKWVAGTALIGLSLVALVGFSVLAGELLRFLQPGMGFEKPAPWTLLSRYLGAVFVASWLIISFQTWVALRWSSFVVATSAGILLTLSGTLFVNASWGRVYPWALPGLVANGFNKGMPLPQLELLVGGLGGVVVGVLACRSLARREVL